MPSIDYRGKKKFGRESLLPKDIARSYTAAQYFLECLKGTGDISLSRRMTGITNDDLKVLMAQDPDMPKMIEEAELEGKERRLREGLELLQKAHTVAMVCEKPMEMLELARTIAPEVTVYPVERERARAKSEFAQADNQKQINSALADLAKKLQDSLKENA